MQARPCPPKPVQTPRLPMGRVASRGRSQRLSVPSNQSNLPRAEGPTTTPVELFRVARLEADVGAQGDGGWDDPVKTSPPCPTSSSQSPRSRCLSTASSRASARTNANLLPPPPSPHRDHAPCPAPDESPSTIPRPRPNSAIPIVVRRDSYEPPNKDRASAMTSSSAWGDVNFT